MIRCNRNLVRASQLTRDKHFFDSDFYLCKDSHKSLKCKQLDTLSELIVEVNTNAAIALVKTSTVSTWRNQL